MQTNWHFYLLLIPFAYLLGSVPFAIIVAKAFGKADPRTVGSGNVGATNVARTAGKKAGAVTLIADILKGAVPVYLSFYFSMPSVDVPLLKISPTALLASLVGVSAFMGHLFPVFLKFKGGKGVATACGVMFVISPTATLLSGVVFIVAVVVKKYVSLGSMLSAAFMPVFLSFLPSKKDYVLTGVIIAVLIIWRHKENIRRLASGTENKI
ncbi:glycerol-3-phosphate 1-O-acyltransferase [bacterium]|nr:MAG: glycerol-3-phosphate 1-O-acyltransferase [bacterium]